MIGQVGLGVSGGVTRCFLILALISRSHSVSGNQEPNEASSDIDLIG